MDIQVTKLDQSLTIKMGFITTTININEINDNFDTFKHFAMLIANNFIEKDQIDLTDLKQIEELKDILQEYLSCFTGFDGNTTITICKDTNKIYLSDMRIENGYIDILKLITLINKLTDM